MGLAQTGDKFLVNRSDQAQVVLKENLMDEIQDDDYMLVNRGDVTHKITGEDVIDSFIPELVITTVILSTFSPRTGETIAVTIDASGGAPPFTISRIWGYRENSSSPDVDLAYDSSSMIVAKEFAGREIYCRVTITDSRGTVVTKKSEYTLPVELSAEAPELSSVTLTKTTTGSRFTDQTFKIETDFSTNGVPASNKYLTAWVDGNFLSPLDLAPITSYVEDPFNLRFYSDLPQGLVVVGGGGLEPLEQNTSLEYTYVLPGGGKGFHTIPKTNDQNNLHYIQFDLPYPLDLHERNVYMYTLDGVPQTYVVPHVYWRRQMPGDSVPGMDPGEYTPWELFISDDSTGQGNYKSLGVTNSRGFTGLLNGTNVVGLLYSFRLKQVWRYYNAAVYGSTVGIALISAPQYTKFASAAASGYAGSTYSDVDFKPTLKFQDSRNFDKLQLYEFIQENGGTGFGEIVEIDTANSTLILNRLGPWESTGVRDEPPIPLANHSWQVGNTVSTMPKSDPDARQYLLFSADQNVIDLTKDTVAPVNIGDADNQGFNLNFPSQFPTGQAPDDEILAGSEITVSVYAENSVGKSANVQDSLVPGTARNIELSETDRNAMLLKQATYDVRRGIQEKATLVQQLLNQGLTQAEIDAALA